MIIDDVGLSIEDNRNMDDFWIRYKNHPNMDDF